MTNLETIDFYMVSLSVVGMKQLKKALINTNCSNLKAISIRGCELNDECVNELMNGIK